MLTGYIKSILIARMEVTSLLCLTQIWVYFLGVCFEVVEGKVTPPPSPPCLKLGRTMLETSNLVPKDTHILNFRA